MGPLLPARPTQGRRARRTAASATAVGLALTLTLTGCQTGTDEEPTSASTPAATPSDPAPTPEPAESSADEPAAEPSEAPAGAGAEGLVNGPNAITSPGPGASVAGPAVTVTGEGTAFEATLNYHVLDAASGAVVQDVAYTMAGANGEVGPWTIELTLDPGTYTVEVWEPDVSDGEGGAEPFLNLVEVTFTVT